MTSNELATFQVWPWLPQPATSRLNFAATAYGPGPFASAVHGK